MLKVADGGWFSLAVGGAIAGLMLCWRRGASELHHRLQEKAMPLPQFVDNIDSMVVARSPGTGVWLTKVERGASPVLLHHVKHNRVMHRTVMLMTVVGDRRPRVPLGERHSIEQLGHGFYRIQVRLGFMQTPDIPMTLMHCQLPEVEADPADVHYYIAHEIVVRRARDSAMAAMPFAVYAFLTRIASRAPDFFRIPTRACPR